MPLFVFISGFLAKRIFKNGQLNVDKILSLIVLALVYKTLLKLFGNGFTFDYLKRQLFYFSSAPWYLFSLATWYCMVPLFNRLRPVPAILLSLVIALLVGFYPAIGKTFSLSRTLVFLPYFLLGYYCNRERFLAIKEHRIVGFIFCSIAVLMTVYLVISSFYPIKRFFYLVYCATNYHKDDLSNGVLGRVCFYFLAIIYSLALIFLMPQRKLSVISYCGQHTLQIFVLHRFARNIFKITGFYDLFFLRDNILSLIGMIVVTIIVTAICLIPINGRILDSFLQLKWKCLTQE